MHAIWWDPHNSNHILIGTDGGAATLGHDAHLDLVHPNLPIGLFYHVGYDNETPFNVCGGMQDNYDWCGPSAVRTRARHHERSLAARCRAATASSRFSISATRASSTASRRTATSTRHNRVTGESKTIRPSAQNVTTAHAGGEPYRCNWDTPMVFSPNDPGVLLVAGNHVFRSTDRGDSWTAISPDLTTNANRDGRRDDGREGQRRPHLQERRHRRVADDRLARRIAETAGRSTTPAPTTAW